LRDLRAYHGAPDPFGHRAQLAPVDHAVARRVARDAEWAEQRITPRLTSVSQEVSTWLGPSAQRDVSLHGLDHAVKDRDSLNRKLALEVSSTGRPAAALAPRVNDTVRYALTVPHGAYVDGAEFAVDRMGDRGFRLAAVKSFWDSNRYRGLNLTFHDPATGRQFELQVHTPDSWQATVDTHPDYALFRSTAIPPALKEFFRQRIAARFSLVPTPDDVSLLPRLLHVRGGPALMTTPGLRTVPGVVAGAGVSAGVDGARSVALGNDE
jgi:hypothetical protein